MKRTLLIIAASLTAAALGPRPGMAESFNVTVVAGHPPVFRWVRMIPESFEPAVNENLAALGHEMTFDEQFGGSIAGVGEELETVEQGLAEIGTCQSLFDPSKMPLQNVTYYTPFVSSDIDVVGEVMGALQDDPRMQTAYDDNNVVYLGAPMIIDDYLLMTDFPVESIGDLEGRKIAAPGAAVNWLSGTGAVAVAGNLTTYYNELQTGVYDGVIVFASAAAPGKLYEVAPYATRLGLGAQYAGSLCANRDWFEGLDPAVQKALTDAADTTGAWYLQDLSAAVEAAFATMTENGATVTDAPEEMRAAWTGGMTNAAADWAGQLDGMGYDASSVLSDYLDAMRQAGATPLRAWDEN